jgi:hypothetical protein
VESERSVGEPRWPMALAVVATGVLRAALPSQLRNGDARWLFLIVVGLLLTLIIGDPGRIDRDVRWLRVLTGSMIGLITLANASAAVRIVVNIINMSRSRTMPRCSWRAAGRSG